VANVSFLQELLTTVAEQGRQLLQWSGRSWDASEDIAELAEALVSVRGEASGVAIADQILRLYQGLSSEQKRTFFQFLAHSLQPREEKVREAASAYLEQPSQEALSRLQAAVESPRQEFFRRLNLAPGATGKIVAMRSDLLKLLASEPSLSVVDADLRHLLYSWFNRGFLVLRRIDWQTPAAILEKIIAYEAVHAIKGWDDLRRRLDPKDRRCFAFFHPSLVDEPLIFVEVALADDMADSIASLIEDASDPDGKTEPTTAIFYSISNCQDGLRGISFGNFLIKQVVEDLAREMPTLKTFVTLSPVPQFARWLASVVNEDETGLITPELRQVLQNLSDTHWIWDPERVQTLEGPLTQLAAHYLVNAKSSDGRPVDPVARFHLGNGARLERINWLADTSAKGLRESHGIMVNYRYDLKEFERNHEAYANEGVVATSRSVRSLLRTAPKLRVPKNEPRMLPAPESGDEAQRTAEMEPVER
jgi:malonyl-CoA decarboxylase